MIALPGSPIPPRRLNETFDQWAERCDDAQWLRFRAAAAWLHLSSEKYFWTQYVPVEKPE